MMNGLEDENGEEAKFNASSKYTNLSECMNIFIYYWILQVKTHS